MTVTELPAVMTGGSTRLIEFCPRPGPVPEPPVTRKEMGEDEVVPPSVTVQSRNRGPAVVGTKEMDCPMPEVGVKRQVPVETVQVNMALAE